MGEIINIDFNREKNKAEEKSHAKNSADNVLDFKEKQEKKDAVAKQEREVGDIIEKGSKNEDGTYEIKFNLKLENTKRETLKEYLISQGLHFYSIDNEMNANDSGISLDLDIDKDQISDLLTFFKKEGISYTPIE